jgi:hypothetical protein
MRRLRLLAVPFALAFGPMAAAHAQTIYRCGTTYSQQPCVSGQAVTVAAAQPSREEAARAAAAAKTDAERAEVLRRARIAQEKNAPKAIVMQPVQQPATEVSKPAAKAGVPRGGKLEQFTAVSGKPGKDKGAKRS